MAKMMQTEIESLRIHGLWLHADIKVVGDAWEELLEENAELVSKYDLDPAQQYLP